MERIIGKLKTHGEQLGDHLDTSTLPEVGMEKENAEYKWQHPTLSLDLIQNLKIIK